MKESILPENVQQRDSLEIESLRRTRAVMRRRALDVALAVFFTTSVLCVLPPFHPLVILMRKGGVWVALALFTAGAIFWGRFLMGCRELKSTGLPPVRGNGPRLAWLAGGWLVAEAINGLIFGATGHEPRFYFTPSVAFFTIWLGERLHQCKPVQMSTLEPLNLNSRPDDNGDQANG